MSSRSIRRRATLGLLAGAAACLLGQAGALRAAAAADGLTIELNKVEEIEGGCQTFFLIDNRSGHVFDGFRLDLVLFDREGIIADRLYVDLAPVRHDKRTVSTYVFPGTPCAEIGSILVNDIPLCKARDGGEVDCVDILKVSGRDSIPLQK